MDDKVKILKMRFDGTVTNRDQFLGEIRESTMSFTGEIMTLDALINEIAKNIFDHAHGRGSLMIEFKNSTYKFEIKDDGEESFDFEKCVTHSRLAGNGINFGVGLEMILDIAQSLGINLHISTSHGFSYSGTYTPRKN